MKRVSKWKNSEQRRRWVASSLIEIEGRFKTVEGYKQLPLLRENMKNFNCEDSSEAKKVA